MHISNNYMYEFVLVIRKKIIKRKMLDSKLSLECVPWLGPFLFPKTHQC